MVSAGAPVRETLFAGSGIVLVRTDYPAGLRQPRHHHEYTSVTLLLTGAVEERVGSCTRVGDCLQVGVKQAGVEHACRWGAASARTLSVELHEAVLKQVQEPGSARTQWSWIDREEAAAAVIRLYRALEEGHLEKRIDDLVPELLAAVVRGPEPDRRAPPSWIRDACEALRESGPGRCAVRQLADRAGVHPVHFARVFSRHVGCSPTDYMRWLRIRRAAATLVEKSDLDIGRLPYRCGYYDHAHLCREFKSSLGLTPTLFRSLSAPTPAWPGGTARR